MVVAGHDRQRRLAELDMKRALVLFADAPTTELAPGYFAAGFTPEECVCLLAAYYRDAFEAMAEVQDEDENTSLILCHYPGESLEAFEEADLNGCSLLAQRGGSRPERLENCLSDLRDLGFASFNIIVRPLPVIDAECLLELREIADESGNLVLATTSSDHVVLAEGMIDKALQTKPFQQLLGELGVLKEVEAPAGVTIVSGLAAVEEAVDRSDLEKQLNALDGVGYFTRRALKKLRNGVTAKG